MPVYYLLVVGSCQSQLIQLVLHTLCPVFAQILVSLKFLQWGAREAT